MKKSEVIDLIPEMTNEELICLTKTHDHTVIRTAARNELERRDKAQLASERMWS